MYEESMQILKTCAVETPSYRVLCSVTIAAISFSKSKEARSLILEFLHSMLALEPQNIPKNDMDTLVLSVVEMLIENGLWNESCRYLQSVGPALCSKDITLQKDMDSIYCSIRGNLWEHVTLDNDGPGKEVLQLYEAMRLCASGRHDEVTEDSLPTAGELSSQTLICLFDLKAWLCSRKCEFLRAALFYTQAGCIAATCAYPPFSKDKLNVKATVCRIHAIKHQSGLEFREGLINILDSFFHGFGGANENNVDSAMTLKTQTTTFLRCLATL